MLRETKRYEDELLQRLGTIRQEKLEAIGVGVDVDQYKFWTGYLRCIKDVVSIMEEVRVKIDKD